MKRSGREWRRGISAAAAREEAVREALGEAGDALRRP